MISKHTRLRLIFVCPTINYILLCCRRILISAKCRISEQNKNGDTALHIAAAMGRRKLTRILLEADCDKNIRNKQNESAREIALRKDLNEILEILDDHVLKKERKVKTKKRSKSKVRFDAEKNAGVTHFLVLQQSKWMLFRDFYLLMCVVFI